jgi:hypothetical protein
MQYKTLASAVEAIMNNECSIKNDDVPSLQRACKYVWPDEAKQFIKEYDARLNAPVTYTEVNLDEL